MLSDTPSLDEYVKAAAESREAGIAAFNAAADLDALEAARIEYLGDKRGKLLVFQKGLGKLPNEAKRDAGRTFNELKTQLNEALEARRQELKRTSAHGPKIDLTMPARRRWRGGKHPVTLVIDEIAGIFRE